MSDGSSGHLYSISATPEQLRKVNIPTNEGLDAVLITTQQGGITYVVAYAAPLGTMAEFEGIFQNMLNSVRFGSVGFGGIAKSEVPAPSEVPDVGSAEELAALTSNNSLSNLSAFETFQDAPK